MLLWKKKEVKLDASGNAVKGDSFCPRPLSRKKLRSMMRNNRVALTSGSLFAAFNRKPGPGKFRHRLGRELDMLQKAANKAGEQGLEQRAGLMLERLSRMFSGRPPLKQSRQAQRGK